MSDSPTGKSTSTPVSARWWHSGIRSLVRFAARMPATRAVANASPFGRPPVEISATTRTEVRKVPAATAVRLVAPFSVTSTMCAAPRSSRCDSESERDSPAVPVADGLDAPDAPAIGDDLPIDDGDRVQVGQVGGGQREHQLAE